MIRTKGEPGTGDVIQAVRHMRAMNAEIRRVQGLRQDELYEAAKQLQVPVELVEYVHDHGRLPVVNFAAGGVATPADAALMMQLGAEGVFVGSGIFKSGDPAKRAAAHRPGCDQLSGRQAAGQAVHQFGRGHGGHQRERDRAAHGGAGQIRWRPLGFWPSRGPLQSTPPCWTGWGRSTLRSASAVIWSGAWTA